MDINSGFVRDQDGLINMYAPNQPAEGHHAVAPHDHADADPISFDGEEYALYKSTIQSIRARIMMEFGLEELYFTAPTFVTREVGNESHWRPKSMHDEYWHPHVDKNNTAHYDYSGLLYLNEHGTDYTGGMFAFLDGPRPAQSVPCYDEDLQVCNWLGHRVLRTDFFAPSLSTDPSNFSGNGGSTIVRGVCSSSVLRSTSWRRHCDG